MLLNMSEKDFEPIISLLRVWPRPNMKEMEHSIKKCVSEASGKYGLSTAEIVNNLLSNKDFLEFLFGDIRSLPVEIIDYIYRLIDDFETWKAFSIIFPDRKYKYIYEIPREILIRAIDTHTFNDLIKRFDEIHKLDLRNTKITDVSALGNIHTLNLSYTNVKDVNALKNVHTLNLSGTKVKDVSALGNVYKLNLNGTEVKDVSALGNVRVLILSRTDVTDVSALRNVRNLDLSDTDVTDVSALGNVHTLNLDNTLVTDVSALGNVDTLYLRYTKVTDVSALRNVRKLYFDKTYVKYR